jgi:hypothetical protein
MSFLIDPFLLVVCGAVIVWLRNRGLYRVTPHVTKILGGLVLAMFWVIAGSLYLNLGWFDWMWLWTGRAVTGRDFMINSCVFRFEYTFTSGVIDVVALVLFGLYPVWLYCGVFIGYLLFGRHEGQTGIVGLL